MSVIFITYAKYTVSTRFIPVNVDLDHLAQVVSIRLHHCSRLPSSIWYSLEESHYMQSILQGWRVTPPLFEGRAPTLIIWNSSANEMCLNSSICLIIPHLLESVWTHRYLFYTLGYNQYFFVTQIVPALTTWTFSRIGSCVPVTYPPTNMWLLWFLLIF